MATSLSPHQLCLPASFASNRRQALPLFAVKNLNPEQFLVISYTSKSLRPLSSVGPLHASPSSSSFTEASNAQLQRASTLREICHGHVPEHVLLRMEEIGFVTPTDMQLQALPVLFSGCDCILHAQTGSGKTLAYLLLIYSAINTQRSAVQALIVVPTRELGMQVTKVARMLAAKPVDVDSGQKTCTIMALLDGGMLKRHRSWLKAEPPMIVVATVASLCQMLQKHVLNLEAMKVLVVDEVDFIFSSSKQVSSIRKLLTMYSSSSAHQTIFASASIPQHRHFVHACIQQKWTKNDVVHIHVNPVEPMPACIRHRYMICLRNQRCQALVSLLQSDAPESAIIFVNEQSEKSKKAGNIQTITLLVDVLKKSFGECSEILLLEEDMNFNQRATSLSEMRKKGPHLLVATDIAARGVDLPETTHIYNFDLPKTAVHYLHRAGRTGQMKKEPASKNVAQLKDVHRESG